MADDDPRAVLDRLRRRQGGAVTRAQALAGGHSAVEVAALLRRGTWLAPERGTYVLAQDVDPDEPHAEHALRVAARSLALGGGHVASRRSAALVLGLPLLGPVPAPPEVVRAPRRPTDRSSSRSVKVAALVPEDVVRWRGVACTSPARLVCDLARTHGQVEALLVASDWRAHVALAAARAHERRHTVLRSAVLERTGCGGIPVPSRAARPQLERQPA